MIRVATRFDAGKAWAGQRFGGPDELSANGSPHPWPAHSRLEERHHYERPVRRLVARTNEEKATLMPEGDSQKHRKSNLRVSVFKPLTRGGPGCRENAQNPGVTVSRVEAASSLPRQKSPSIGAIRTRLGEPGSAAIWSVWANDRNRIPKDSAITTLLQTPYQFKPFFHDIKSIRKVCDRHPRPFQSM